MFDEVVKTKKVRNGVIAYKCLNGFVFINKQTYIGYSLTDAIKQFTKNFPVYKKVKNN